jgi:hypothetical protein
MNKKPNKKTSAISLTKLDSKLENLGNRIDNSLEEFARVFRGDYDELASRVKRLEMAVFKR